MPFSRDPNSPKKPPYVKVSYPDRLCVVSRTIFTPTRRDQILCSYKEDYTCANRLRKMERDAINSGAYFKALDRAEGRCFRCGGVGEGTQEERPRGLLTPMTLALSVLVVYPYGPEPRAVVPSCRSCRQAHYLDLAQLLDDVA